MVPAAQRAKLIAIVGPTASGKSNLAMRLAKDFNGEIVSADSRMVYTGMDIGTGKPTDREQKLVPHHLINIVNINQFFSAAEYKALAQKAIKSIQAREKTAILVGGSGLYVDAVLFDFDFRPPPSRSERRRLEAMTVEQLNAEIAKRKLTPPLNYRNKRHLIRCIETGGAQNIRKAMRPDAIVIGILPGSEELKRKISSRNSKMINNGLEQEVRGLTQRYGKEARSLDAIGYREWQDYFDGKISRQDVKNLITNNSIAYARRQKTWFKRNEHIKWFTSPQAAYKYAKNSLLNT
ncbi:MAG TPA: tRNA (adenosine(37)-N6)-dimethylallyltransferase MiaA [Candidatus Nitrosopolaris sp.]|nr:tRNA (adenosine(37)-N6)-dimethylallyltransferase MiaA [Candidatus Nitrosopolaris sp.]